MTSVTLRAAVDGVTSVAFPTDSGGDLGTQPTAPRAARRGAESRTEPGADLGGDSPTDSGVVQPAEAAGHGVDAAPPLLLITGSAPSAVLTALLAEPVPEPPPGAFTVLRYGAPGGYA